MHDIVDQSSAPSTIAAAHPCVLSVNVGPVREVVWRDERVLTGIWKYPVHGRIPLRGVNFEGDDQADRTVHGGVDKAVYAYARSDYAFWHDHDGLETPWGLFGENLTTDGLDLAAAVVGERWRVGSVVLEVAQPRLPCYKLGIRMGDPRFPKRFQTVGRHGAYLRVVQEGDIGAGDTIEVTSRPSHGITLDTMVRALREPAQAAALRAIAGLPAFWQHVAAER